MPLLAHEIVEAPGGRSSEGLTMLVLHGILASKSNWKGFARKLVELRPSWRVVIADLRNHGESHGLAPPHTIASCADDVDALARALGGVDVIVGHSYGGKVALAWAGRRPSGLQSAWIIDSPPGVRRFGWEAGVSGAVGSEIERVLAAVRAVTMPVATRRALVEELQARGLGESLVLWMTTNLRPADPPAEGFVWRFDLAAIPEMLASFGATDLWAVVDDPGPVKIVFVRGARSDRFTPDELARTTRAVARGTVIEHVLPAGHWVHVDDPNGLLALFGSIAP